ncbi:hypothetical protein E4U23_004937 [Claviceps purpurea]|nr:hypothetical protein E4U23_004937 [Claviceps purpurea]
MDPKPQRSEAISTALFRGLRCVEEGGFTTDKDCAEVPRSAALAVIKRLGAPRAQTNAISCKLLERYRLDHLGAFMGIFKTITRVNYNGIQWLLVFQDEYNTMMQYKQQVTTKRNTTFNDSIFYGLATERTTINKFYFSHCATVPAVRF